MTSTEQKKTNVRDWDRFDALVHELSGEIEQQRFLDSDGYSVFEDVCTVGVVYGYILARLLELGREDDALFFAWSVRQTCFVQTMEDSEDPHRQSLSLGVFRFINKQAA